MNQPGRRAGRRLMPLAGLVVVVAGCSSSATDTSASTAPSVTPSTRAEVAAANALERALLANKRSPHPTAAACRPATAAEVAHGPFGAGAQQQFICRLVVRGSPGRYDVQVLGNGCYVAERHPKGQAIYGCGVRVRG